MCIFEDFLQNKIQQWFTILECATCYKISVTPFELWYKHYLNRKCSSSLNLKWWIFYHVFFILFSNLRSPEQIVTANIKPKSIINFFLFFYSIQTCGCNWCDCVQLFFAPKKKFECVKQININRMAEFFSPFHSSHSRARTYVICS